MDKNAKIYVAGHTGLVGSAIVRRLRALGYHRIVTRTSSELDLRNQQNVEDFFSSEKPEYVFLAAARVGGILANSTYKADFIYDNIQISTNVIGASYRRGVRKLLNLGSSCIYPKMASQPIKEEYLLTGPLEETNEPYAVAKIAAIKLCRYFNEQYGTNFISVMPTNLYGPYDNFNLETSHVLPALIRKFHLAALLRAKLYDEIRKDLKKRPLGFAGVIEGAPTTTTFIQSLNELGITDGAVRVWGSGQPRREFLHVDDLAEACVYLMQKFDYAQIGELVNIGVGEDLTIKELSSIIMRVVGFEGNIEFDASKPDGVPRKLLDISRLTSLGWTPRIALDRGIEQTFEWYIHSQDSKIP